MNHLHIVETPAPVVPEVIELNDLRDFAQFALAQAKVVLDPRAFQEYLADQRNIAAHIEGANNAYLNGTVDSDMAAAQAQAERHQVEISDTAWASFAAEQARLIDAQPFTRDLLAIQSADDEEGVKAKKARLYAVESVTTKTKRKTTLDIFLPNPEVKKKRAA